MTNENTVIRKPQRIQWIDIAKGISIFLVIIGHTAPFGILERNIIFSFHMPLFFILSGYHFKIAQNWDEARERFWKNVRHLLLPLFLLWCLNLLLPMFQGKEIFTTEIIKRNITALFWSSGVTFKGHPGLGMLWFMVSMFCGFQIINGIGLLFHGEYRGYLYASLAFIGMYLGMTQKWLPLNFDVTLVCVFFLYLGMLWKKHQDFLEKYCWFIFAAGSVFWSFCIQNQWYIELAARRYPLLWVGVVEAVAGTFAVAAVSRALEGNAAVCRFLSFIGRNTMIIYGIHYLDRYLLPNRIYDAHWKIACVYRTLMVLGIFLIVYLLKEMIFKKVIRKIKVRWCRDEK